MKNPLLLFLSAIIMLFSVPQAKQDELQNISFMHDTVVSIYADNNTKNATITLITDTEHVAYLLISAEKGILCKQDENFEQGQDNLMLIKPADFFQYSFADISDDVIYIKMFDKDMNHLRTLYMSMEKTEDIIEFAKHGDIMMSTVPSVPPKLKISLSVCSAALLAALLVG